MAGRDTIKLFKFVQESYQDIGIFPPQSNQNRRSINLKKWFIPFSNGQIFISSAAYLLFEANSMIEYGITFYTCLSIVFCSTEYLILLWQMENILNFIENCERFIEKRMRSTIVYKNTNEKIERLTEYFAYATFVSITIFQLSSLIYTIVNYYILDSGKKSFFLFYPTWWPFDWKTPFGYLVAWIGQCVGVVASIISIIPFFNFVFGSCWLFIVMVEDITNDVAAFNNTVKTLKDGSDRADLMERFCDIVQHYSDAKECVNNFNEMYEYSLYTFFLWDMLAMSCTLVTLQFQLWNDDSKLVEIMMLSISTLWVFVFNLGICEPGERVTNQFDQFGVEFDRCEWNKIPIEMQRMYLIFLSDTQQPKNIQSFGGILCTRDTFKKITNKAFSYFMTLRKFRA